MSDGLNPSQRAAVEHHRGPLLVLAGAGSGKTRVITMRIARLLERGVRPPQILAVSFTNKAAEEMRERMVPLVGHHAAEQLVLSTFHSFGVRFLQEENRVLGYDGRFVIFDQADALGLVRELMRQARLGEGSRKLDAGAVLARISLWKNELKAPASIPESDYEYDAVAREIYPKYEAGLRNMHAVDFDDLIGLPVRILSEHPEVRARWQARFRYILIDEFQDTNGGQLKLLLLLANELRNVCVVGDDDQSIYAFRGADVRNILEFERHFAGATIVKLEDNYRSRKAVLDVANAAIAQSTTKRHDKTLRAARGGGDKVRIVQCTDPGHEARFVAEEIRDIAKSQVAHYRDIAILYRSNLQAKIIEEELRTNGIPYRLFGGTQFFDRKEVKDAAAYLRVAINTRDDISLRRILNYPPRGIGDTTIERLNRYRLIHGLSLHDAVARAEQLSDVPDNAQRSAKKLLGLLSDTRRAFETGRGLGEASLKLFEGVGLKEALLDPSEPQGARRWENVQFLVRSIERFEGRTDEDRPTVAQFLARITLRKDEQEETEEEPNQVTLSTLHGSKGLEFKQVFFIGLVEGQLPHTRTTDPKATDATPTDVEEERRLFYVGVTRARDRLYMSHYKRRMLRGKVMEAAPSRFLDGLPEDAVEPYSRVDRPALAPDEMADLASALLARLKAR